MACKIIICTMVKDEDDIVEDWILYHGEIFGYNNIFIFDNFSTDNTFAICQKYVKNGIHLFREGDYKKKGIKMTEVMRNFSCDIFFPIDTALAAKNTDRQFLGCEISTEYYDKLMKLVA